jgi:hypothetical protein
VGYWGYGNFEGDDPRDFLADMLAVWERIIDHTLAGDLAGAAIYFGPDMQPISQQGQEAVDRIVMPTAEIMIAVAEKLECDYLPEPTTVSKWSAEVLRVYDTEGFANWGPGDERRQAIVETFARLSKVVEARVDPDALSETDPDETLEE